VPKIVARLPRVRRLANDTAKLIEQKSGAPVPRVGKSAVTIVHDSYGGAYGRETAEAKTATDQFRTVSSIELDSTYSAKAFATALEFAERTPTVFWLTFDSRTLTR